MDTRAPVLHWGSQFPSSTPAWGRCETLITQAEFGALTNRDIEPAKCLVPRNPDFRASRYYRYLIKRHGRCALAVRHGAKAVGLILSSDPKTMS